MLLRSYAGTRQLRYFVAVAETEHIGNAADRLGIAQSPLSRQIQQLEARLGLALFERSKQRIFLTREGKAFLHEARRLLMQAANVEQQARRIGKGETGVIPIGYVEGALHAGVLRNALCVFHSAHPDVHIRLSRRRSQDQIDSLIQGDIDVGHVYTPPLGNSKIISRLVVDGPFMLALPKDHALAVGRRNITREQLHAQPFIGLPHNLSENAYSRILDACKTAGFAPDIRYEAMEPSTVLQLVSAGLGMAIVQGSLREMAPKDVVFRPVGFFPRRLQIFAVQRSDDKPIAVSAYQAAIRWRAEVSCMRSEGRDAISRRINGLVFA